VTHIDVADLHNPLLHAHDSRYPCVATPGCNGTVHAVSPTPLTYPVVLCSGCAWRNVLAIGGEG